MYPLKKANTKAKKDKLKPGTYEAVVEKINDAPGYVPGDAVQITYKLTRDEKSWPFKEVFVLNPDDSRYADFKDYLEEHGIEDIDDFLGCHEEVELLKELVDGRGVFLNIVNRKMVKA